MPYRPRRRHRRPAEPGGPGGLQAFQQLYPPDWPGRAPEQQSHEGYEWMYVLSGRLRLLLGDHDVALKAGEAAEFDTHVPHAFATVEAAEVLGTCTSGHGPRPVRGSRGSTRSRRHLAGTQRSSARALRDEGVRAGRLDRRPDAVRRS